MAAASRPMAVAEHWDELNTLEVFQQMGAIDMHRGRA